MEPDDRRMCSFNSSRADGNAVVSAVGLWAARDGIHLRIDTTGDGSPATATNRPNSVRDHRILFRDLQRMLMANGCWEFGDEGVEAKATGGAED